jgi:DNA modification methylase
MVNDGFESFQTQSNYDLVLTSPPYYNLEIYEDESSKGQSIYKRTLDQWFDDFLIPSLDKAVEALRDGGFMVININNIKGQPDFVIRMVQTVSKRKDVEYLGNLPQWSGVAKKSGQPIWIWRKIATQEVVVKKKKKTPEKEEEVVVKKKKKTPEKEEEVVVKKKKKTPEKEEEVVVKKKTPEKEEVVKKKKKTPEKEEDGYVVNPKTGKKIKVGGELHKRLIDEGLL